MIFDIILVILLSINTDTILFNEFYNSFRTFGGELITILTNFTLTKPDNIEFCFAQLRVFCVICDFICEVEIEGFLNFFADHWGFGITRPPQK